MHLKPICFFGWDCRFDIVGLYFLPSEAVCSKMELTESSFNSSLLKILIRCFVIAGLCTPNKIAIFSWVSQTFSL